MKGLFRQIQESEPTKIEPLTEESMRKMFNLLEKQHIAYKKHLAKLEKEWAEHWARKQKENNEEPPLWLMLLTAPSNNLLNHGVFYSSREFIEKHKKWLL